MTTSLIRADLSELVEGAVVVTLNSRYLLRRRANRIVLRCVPPRGEPRWRASRQRQSAGYLISYRQNDGVR